MTVWCIVYMHIVYCTSCSYRTYETGTYQGIGIKGKEIALVWHEKASPTALQTSTVNFTHTLLVQTNTYDVYVPWDIFNQQISVHFL